MAESAISGLDTVIPALARAFKRDFEDRLLDDISVSAMDTARYIFPEFEENLSIYSESPSGAPLVSSASGAAYASQVAAFADMHGNTRPVFGYPLWMDANKQIYPCFLRRCELDTENGAGLRLDFEPIGKLRLNLALFKKFGFSNNALQELVSSLSEQASSGLDKFNRIMRSLELEGSRFADAPASNPLDFTHPPSSDGWYNSAIMIAPQIPAERMRPLKELEHLGRPQILKKLGASGLAALAKTQLDDSNPDADSETGNVQQTFEVHRLGFSQSRALRAATHEPLTVSVAAPGSGPMALVVNQIATAVLNNEKILYLADTPAKVAKLSDHLTKLLGQDRRFAVTLLDTPAGSSTAKNLCDSIYKMELALNQPENDEQSGGPKKKLPLATKGELAQLANEAPAVEEMTDSIRQLHAAIKELGDRERLLSREMGNNWSNDKARTAAVHGLADALTDWRDTAHAIKHNTEANLLSRLKRMLSRSDRVAELAAEIRDTVRQLPEAIAEEIYEDLAPGQLTLAQCNLVLDKIAAFMSWRAVLQARAAKIRNLTRISDSKSIELQVLKHASSKAAGARALLKSWFEEKLLSDSQELQRKIGVYFRIRNARLSAMDSKEQKRLAAKDSRAIRILSKQLPVWLSTYGALAKAVPLDIAQFDLVICDNAETQSLPALLTAIARGKRAAVIGAETKNDDVSAGNGSAVRAAEGLPQWVLPLQRNGLQILAHRTDAPVRGHHLLLDHFRSHPFIADFLNSEYYDGKLQVRTTARAAGEGIGEDTAGIHWQSVEARIRGNHQNLYSPEECREAIELLKKWQSDGIFRLAPRRTIALVTPHFGQAQRLRQQLSEMQWPETVTSRILIRTPETIQETPIDLLIVMPGLSADHSPEANRRLANLGGIYHDVIGLVRAGVHIVGDRDIALESGGALARLSAQIGETVTEEDIPDTDEDDEDFEEAFGLKEQRIDYLTPLIDMFRQENVAYRSQLLLNGLNLQFTILSPHGGRYNIELNESDTSKLTEKDIETEIARDRKVNDAGYQIIRFSPHQLMEEREHVIEQIRHIV